MKIRLPLFLVLITLSLDIQAQNFTKIDSLLDELKQSEGVERANLYLDIGWEYRKSHPDSMVYYCDKSSDLTGQIQHKSGLLAKILNFKGVAYHYKGESLKSFDYFNRAIEASIEVNDSIQYAHSLNSLGRMHHSQGDFLKAYDNYNTALKIFKNQDNLQGQGYCYKSLAELYVTQKRYDKALEMSQKTFDIRVKTNNLHGQASILIEIADIHKLLKNYDKAFDFYLKAKIKAESINDQINIANINLGISDLYQQDEKITEALIFANKAYHTVENTSNIDLLSRVLIQLGTVYSQMDEDEKALKYLFEGIGLMQNSQDLPLLEKAYLNVSQVFKKQGKFEQAYEYYVLYNSITLRYSSSEAARLIEQYESRIEIENKDRQNQLLLANQAKDQAIIEKQKVQNIALVVVIFISIAGGVLIYLMGQKRRFANKKLIERNKQIEIQREEIKAKNDKIKEQNQNLQIRNKELAEINNEKDTLMSIVAHDLKSPFSRVLGILELLGLSSPSDEQKSYINLLRDIANGGVELIRDLLDVNAFEEEKRQPVLATIDIHSFLLEKTKLFYADGKSKGIEIKMPNLSNQVYLETDRIYLSRILDNLISNAIKFSPDQSEVILSAGAMQNYVYISVKDFGPGFLEEDKQHLYKKFTKLSARPTGGESSNGLGLAIVKILTDRLGVEIILNSTPDKGSEFIIKFPIEKNVETSLI